MKRSEFLVQDLCNEIDRLEESVAYWKEQAEHWRKEHGRVCTDNIKHSQNMIGGMLMLALKGATTKARAKEVQK